MRYGDDSVDTQLYRAKKAGLPATLTQEQWASTLAYFQQKCAYCQIAHYEQLDHFIPIRQGGGTTYENCVPACASCNTRKDHPRMILLEDEQKAQEALARVQTYLDNLRNEFPAERKIASD